MAPRAAGRPTYRKGYTDGWNHRNTKGVRKLKKNAAIRKNVSYHYGYEHGWHDGEGRGVTLKEFQDGAPNSYPPRPSSWERYEKTADLL